MRTASLRNRSHPSRSQPDTDPTEVDGGQIRSSSHVARALRALPDWSVSSAVLRATYASDVSQDGIWSALADSAGLSAEDLTLEWE
jgi:hypothetical protein